MSPVSKIKAKGVGLVGGGRWSRMIAAVLQDVLPENGAIPVSVVSPGNPQSWFDVAERSGWQVATTTAQVLANEQISHVIVARRARDHAPTVMECLGANKTTLVEKPFCLTLEQADNIIVAAQGKECVTGHVFAHARNLIRFCNACLARGDVRVLRLIWGDPVHEQRHGAPKRFDHALNVVQDVMPHAWSILRPFLPEMAAISISSVSSEHGGARVEVAMQAAGVELSLTTSRIHPSRERRLIVQGDGWDAEIDFSIEPGRAHLDNQPIDVARGFFSPLRAEIQSFLNDEFLPLTSVAAAREAIELSVRSISSVRRQQAAQLRQGDIDNSALRYALHEILLGGLNGGGVASNLSQIATWAQVPEERLLNVF